MKKELEQLKELSEHLKAIIRIQDNIIFSCENNFEIVGKFDKETQNILHSLELDNLKYGERNKLATKLVHIRQERRKSKDIVEMYNSLRNNIYKITNLQKEYYQEVLRTIKIQENINKRNYTKR